LASSATPYRAVGLNHLLLHVLLKNYDFKKGEGGGGKKEQLL
jgi:hypothetical protein